MPDLFLSDLDDRPWTNPPVNAPDDWEIDSYFLGEDSHVQVRVLTSPTPPPVGDVRAVWTEVWRKQADPVVLVVKHPGGHSGLAVVCGPSGERPPVHRGVDIATVEALCREALCKADPLTAERYLWAALDEADSEIPGVRNDGLLAAHELIHGVRDRDDWAEACSTGHTMRDLRDRKLVEALGYDIRTAPDLTTVLTDQGTRRAIAVFLEQNETFDGNSDRFNGTSPVSHALAVADREHLDWVVLTRGPHIRLYSTHPDIGVGRKGRASTNFGLDLSLLADDTVGYLPLVFGASALADDGSLTEILDRSADHAADLGSRLRERVYFDAVPVLATAIGKRMAQPLDETELALAYEQTMLVLFRLLFIAYGEDKGLLPYRIHDQYTTHSLKQISRVLTNRERSPFDETATNLWTGFTQLVKAVRDGNTDWGVPAYGGGLFTTETAAGAALDSLELTNAEFGPILDALLVDIGPDGVRGPVDFASLSVREFGTIYEGLLESELGTAPSDLKAKKVKGRDVYVPAADGDTVEVPEGHVYFHNTSGARKSTGSYFTKPFAVDHLLRYALHPAIDDHLARITTLLDNGDDHGAAEAFFDFRCVDIAMGSAHFLVAAIDHIEARFSSFLAEQPIPGVHRILSKLRESATAELRKVLHSEHAALIATGIEDIALLRRLIARRCIYGVDLNPISAELARLSIWIHTFVPGLPLTFLDHNLTVGNSLTGIGTIKEAVDVVAAGDQGSFSRDVFEAQLEAARPALKRLATVIDATTADIVEAQHAAAEARQAVVPLSRVFDLFVLARAGLAQVAPESVVSDPELAEREYIRVNAADAIEDLCPFHFPVAFPEVFLRDRPGFDCILGNPPWEKVKVDSDAWWGLRSPGLRSLKVNEMHRVIEDQRVDRPDLVREFEDELASTERMRSVLHSGPGDFGSGDLDLFKVFAWRFWQLVADRGTIGVVLPRAALAAAGMEAWRRHLLTNGDFIEVTVGTNTGGWLFDDAEHRYSIGLVSIRKTNEPDDVVDVRGPFNSLDAYRHGVNQAPLELPASGLLGWTTSASFPLIPSVEAGRVFMKMRQHSRFDESTVSSSFVPVSGDLHATHGRPHMVFDPPSTDGLWPVYKGASFNLWQPDTTDRDGQPLVYAWADPDYITEVLQAKRRTASTRTNSVWNRFPGDHIHDVGTLPCKRPRIVFRDVARATDSRTVIAALVPPELVLTNKAPYLVQIGGDEPDEALLLGLLSTRIFDWYARRFVEQNVNFHILLGFPFPGSIDKRFRDRIVEVSGALAAVDDRFADWAAAVGVPVGSVSDPDHKQDLIDELDALVAHAYGLDADDVTVIFETFHKGWDHRPRLDAVLAHFGRWAP